MEGTIGEIRMFAGNFAPRNWAFCQGQLMSIAQNTALFSILGTTYGGDGRTTFGLPNLCARSAVGTGSNTLGQTPVNLGQLGGSQTVTLTTVNMPTHNHGATVSLQGSVAPQCLAETGSGTSPVGQFPALSSAASFTGRGQSPDSAMGATQLNLSGTVAVANNGSSQPFNNMNPYLGMNYVICLAGIFPSRN